MFTIFFPRLIVLKNSPGILLAFDRAGLLLLLMFCGELIKQIVVPRGPPAGFIIATFTMFCDESQEKHL